MCGVLVKIGLIIRGSLGVKFVHNYQGRVLACAGVTMSEYDV